VFHVPVCQVAGLKDAIVEYLAAVDELIQGEEVREVSIAS
jgi:hypothetical protein